MASGGYDTLDLREGRAMAKTSASGGGLNLGRSVGGGRPSRPSCSDGSCMAVDGADAEDGDEQHVGADGMDVVAGVAAVGAAPDSAELMFIS